MNTILHIIDHIDQYIAIAVILITLAEAIANLTPTEKDNSIILKIKQWFDLVIPNRAKVKGPEADNLIGRHRIISKIITRIRERKEKDKKNAD